MAVIDDFSIGGMLAGAGKSIMKSLKWFGPKIMDMLGNENVMAGIHRGAKGMQELLGSGNQ